MFFVLTTIAALGLAVLRGLPIEALARGPFRLWPLAAVGVLLHIAVNLAVLSPFLSVRPFPSGLFLGAWLYLASLVCVGGFLLANARYPGFVILLAGLGMNFTVIALNGGQMPGDPNQYAASGFLTAIAQRSAAGQWWPFVPIGSATRLAWLGDRIMVPLPFREPVVISVGDLVIALGCLIFFNYPAGRRSRHSQVRSLR
jgi:hypothetical protein